MKISNGIIKSRKSKNNRQKDNVLQNTTHNLKKKKWKIEQHQSHKKRDELKCSRRLRRSCFISGARRCTVVKIRWSHESGKDRTMITTKVANPWSFVTMHKFPQNQWFYIISPGRVPYNSLSNILVILVLTMSYISLILTL